LSLFSQLFYTGQFIVFLDCLEELVHLWSQTQLAQFWYETHPLAKVHRVSQTYITESFPYAAQSK